MDRKIDRAIDLAETGASLSRPRNVHDGEQLQGRRGHAAIAVAVAKRQLHPFIIELALDLEPFFPQSAGGQDGGKQPERLGGFSDQSRRAGRNQRAGREVCRRSKPGHAAGSHDDA